MIAEKLKKGDGIGIFSPSSPATVFAKDRYERGKSYLKSKGFQIIEGSLTGKSDFYRSGSIQERADEFNELVKNKEVQCIMSSIGGMNSNSILPYIDYEAIKENPKIILGYSDVTAILLAIYEKTGLKTYYGPACVASFGEFPPFVDMTYDYFQDILVNRLDLPYEFKAPDFWTEEFIDWEKQDRSKVKYDNEIVVLKEGLAQGRLIAGNLNTMQGIWATDYMPRIKEGDILMIEDSLLDIATVERSFSLLKLSGVFDRIGGLILGKHEIFDDLGSGRKPYEVLLEVLGQYDFPFLAEFDSCHTHPMITMPIGSQVKLDATGKRVFLIEE